MMLTDIPRRLRTLWRATGCCSDHPYEVHNERSGCSGDCLAAGAETGRTFGVTSAEVSARPMLGRQRGDVIYMGSGTPRICRSSASTPQRSARENLRPLAGSSSAPGPERTKMEPTELPSGLGRFHSWRYLRRRLGVRAPIVFRLFFGVLSLIACEAINSVIPWIFAESKRLHPMRSSKTGQLEHVDHLDAVRC